MYWGDGTNTDVDDSLLHLPSGVKTLAHRYKLEGIYFVNVTVYNAVNREVFSFTSHFCVRCFRTLSGHHLWRKNFMPLSFLIEKIFAPSPFISNLKKLFPVKQKYGTGWSNVHPPFPCQDRKFLWKTDQCIFKNIIFEYYLDVVSSWVPCTHGDQIFSERQIQQCSICINRTSDSL